MKKQVFNPYLPSYEYIPDGSHALWAPDVWHNSNPNVSWAETLEHAEKIGLGTREYELITMK